MTSLLQRQSIVEEANEDGEGENDFLPTPSINISRSFEDKKEENKVESKIDSGLIRRSDDEEFINWEITSIKSGKFEFTSNDKNKKVEKKNSQSKIDTKKTPSLFNELIPEVPVKHQKKELKVDKTMGSSKKEVLKYFI